MAHLAGAPKGRYGEVINNAVFAAPREIFARGMRKQGWWTLAL